MNYGTINKGKVSKTEGQIKKHYSQMTLKEKEFLKSKLNNLKREKLIVSDHLQRKFIGYDLSEVKNLPFKTELDMIIEYNERPMNSYMDRRILVRSKKIYDVRIGNKIEKCNLCVVYSIITNSIITIYWNKSNDNHTSINMNRYDKNLKIIY